ncbi:MAG: zinc-ribbon and DUF3426 domain-containing protein [Methylococcaceae bacterium]
MQTQCPECKSQRSISIEELRSSRGIIQCNECSAMFDALERLDDGLAIKELETNGILPTLDSISAHHKSPWRIAYFFCFIVFVFQIYYFEGYNLTQNPQIRPWLKTICNSFDCQLAVYKNLNELTILHGDFESTEDNVYIFKTAFTNESDFAQRYPSIKLSLQNFTGETFAERVFLPKNYGRKPAELLEPDISAEITMNIAAPSEPIGGYRFELI